MKHPTVLRLHTPYTVLPNSWIWRVVRAFAVVDDVVFGLDVAGCECGGSGCCGAGVVPPDLRPEAADDPCPFELEKDCRIASADDDDLASFAFFSIHRRLKSSVACRLSLNRWRTFNSATTSHRVRKF